MNVLLRGLTFLRRNIGKTIFIFIVVILSMNVISTCIILSQVSKNLEQSAYENQQPIATISTSDTSTASLLGISSVDFSMEQYKSLTTIENVVDINFTTEAILSNSEYVYEDSLINYIALTFDSQFINGYEEKEGYTFDFEEGQYLESENGIILNQQFIDDNNLNIGDELTFAISMDGAIDVDNEKLNQTFTLIGSYQYQPTSTQMKNYEKMATSFGIDVETLISAESIYAFTTPKYNNYLVDLYNQFTEEEKQDFSLMIQPKYTIENEDAATQIGNDASEILGETVEVSIESPVDAEEYGILVSFAGEFAPLIIMPITIIITLLATLIIVLFVRSRKNEFGILLALGEKRVNIFKQIFFEIWLQFIIAATVSIPIGYLIGNQVNVAITEVLLGTSVTMIPLTITAILLIYLLATGIALVATIIPILYTIRLNPNKILI